MSGGTVVTAVLGVCGPERHRVAALLSERAAGAVIPEDEADLAAAVTAAVLEADARQLVLELPTNTYAHDVLALGHPHGGPLPADTRLGEVLTVVDAAHLLADLLDPQDAVAGWSATPQRRPRSVLAIDQIEHATAILIAGWRGRRRRELDRMLSLLAHLNPRARLTLLHEGPTWGSGLLGDHGGSGLATPGWVDVLNDEHDPFVTGHGVSAFRYEHVRPLHPQRLHRLMEHGLEHRYGQLLRSAGFCRFATRPGRIARWDQVGTVISFDLLADFLGPEGEQLTVGQELAFIGLDLDAAALTRALDDCVLTDAELAEGPLTWLTYTDPFPAWQPARTP